MMEGLDSSSESLFFKSQDPEDPRLGNLARPLQSASDLSHKSFVILGYPDDEGIRLNGGRPGAKEAPDAIRQILYRMTPSCEGVEDPEIIDAGNIKMEGSLADRHKRAQSLIEIFLNQKASILTMGGGHDYGYSDFSAFCESVLAQGKRPFIINFDAHLDVRPDIKGEHSGTPFFRLLRDFKNKLEFFEVGIQPWCNSRSHLRWLEDHGGKVVSWSDLLSSGKSFWEVLNKDVFSHFKKGHVLGLSVDMDCFSSAFGPGASQVFPVGLKPHDFLHAWKVILKQYQPPLAGFYEVSPPLDLDNRTSRLCAILMHQFIFR